MFYWRFIEWVNDYSSRFLSHDILSGQFWPTQWVQSFCVSLTPLPSEEADLLAPHGHSLLVEFSQWDPSKKMEGKRGEKSESASYPPLLRFLSAWPWLCSSAYRHHSIIWPPLPGLSIQFPLLVLLGPGIMMPLPPWAPASLAGSHTTVHFLADQPSI